MHKQRVPFWFVFALLFVLASYQIVMNPFGFSDLTQRYTQDVSELLITGPYLYPRTGHEKVSVALISENTLHLTDTGWPWKYGKHAIALDALLALQPKAVVVDFLFVDQRKDDGTLPDLLEEIDRYKKQGVPLYFEFANDVPDGANAVLPQLAKKNVTFLDPTILVNHGIVRQYPIEGKCFANGKVGGTCPSLALRVYEDLYHKKPRVSPEGLMELVWGTRSDPINAKWMHLTDEKGRLRSCELNLGFWRRIFLAFFDTDAVKSRCPYSSIIPVESLMRGDNDADVAHLAKDRIVFYGGGLEGAQDKSFTPVNGLQSNVFVHAMAMDNLITLNGKPEQNVVEIGGMTFDSNPVQVAAIIPVIIILTWIHMRRLRRERQKREEPRRGELLEYFVEKLAEQAWHWLGFGLALGAGLVLTLAAGLSVANWVEVVFVAVELAAMLLFRVPDTIWGYIRHVIGEIELLENNPQEESVT
ncbi:MAG: CHASE2 domain-containing protein [Proteobacteria bacterium]|nr:CHASE2 domain-containing protein [Pseudomonadota bacterium]